MTNKSGRKSENSELESRKRELRGELSDMEQELGMAFSDLQKDIREKANVWYWVKKYPVTALTTSIVIGILAGKRKSNSANSGFFTAEIITELKRVAMRKAIQTVMQQIDEKNAE